MSNKHREQAAKTLLADLGKEYYNAIISSHLNDVIEHQSISVVEDNGNQRIATFYFARVSKSL